jgi:anti-sigma B factor antagonist
MTSGVIESFAGKETFVRVDVAQAEGLMVVRPAGARLDLQAAGPFRLTLLRLIRDGHRRLVVDLADVEFIDSAGLGALISVLKTLKKSVGEGEIHLANVQPGVADLLEILRLDRVLPSFPSVAQAVHSFAEPR